MQPTRLYLDTARLGRMVPGAARAHDAFARLAADEGGSAFFDHFLRGGAADWSAPVAGRYSGLADWRGVGGLKDRIRRLTGVPAELPVLLAHRSAVLVNLAARLLFGPCRNVLVTDLGWPGWQSTLAAAAARAGRRVTTAAVRDGILFGGWGEDDVVGAVRECARRAGCDGAFLSGVSNLGVRLPVGRVVRALEGVRELRFVVVDGSQELNQVPPDLGGGHCDLYLAGCHKWIGAGHTLAVAVYGRRRSRGVIDTRLTDLTEARVVDDPLLRLTASLETASPHPPGETVSLLPLFTAHGALGDAAVRPPSEPLDPSELASLASAAGWSPLLPARHLRSSILLLQSATPALRAAPPDRVREHFARSGVALSAYPGGVIRLSLPPGGLGELERSVLGFALASPFTA